MMSPLTPWLTMFALGVGYLIGTSVLVVVDVWVLTFRVLDIETRRGN